MSDSDRMNLSLVLPIRNQDQLKQRIQQIYDPASVDYHHFLSVEEFTSEFGPSPEDYASVVEYAQANGFEVTGSYRNRMVVPIRGTVNQVQQAFNLVMSVYQHPTENRPFFSADREPAVPANLKIEHISGLNNYSLPHPQVQRLGNSTSAAKTVNGSAPGGSFLGSDMRAAYYGGTSLTGNGESIALVQFDGYNISDVTASFNGTASATQSGGDYLVSYTPVAGGKTYSIPVNNVLLDGVTGQSKSGDDSEAVLDIVQAISMAPGLSQVRVYIGESDASILNAIASENVAHQVSISWSWRPEDPEVAGVFFQEMAAQGQTVFAASGDYGAFSLLNAYFYPAEDPYVTSVGGTSLATSAPGGAWQSEVAWTGSGGGVSPDMIPLPWWQSGVANSANRGSNTYRNVPDVAMESDWDNYNCSMGHCAGSYGGTSFAAPRWAGYMALVNEAERIKGYPPLGFLNPALYALGQNSAYGTSFHDIVSGNNSFGSASNGFNAVSGYDLATGWGSPAQSNLVTALLPDQQNGFWLSSSERTVTIHPARSATVDVQVNSVGTFAEPVTFATKPPPPGIAATFSANPSTTGSRTTISVDAGVPRGTYLIRITGSANGQSASLDIAVQVDAPGFTVSADSTLVTARPGFSNSTDLSISDLGGFQGSVNFAISSPLPPGVTAILSPATPSGTELLTFMPDVSAPVSRSVVSITGRAGNTTAARTVYLDVQKPAFDINIAPMRMSIEQGQSISMTVSVSAEGNYTDPVTLGMFSPLPAGLNSQFNPASIKPGETSIVTVTATSAALLQTTPFVIYGVSADMKYEEALGFPLTVTATPEPSFAVSFDPASVTLPQGRSAQAAVTVGQLNGFAGAVSLETAAPPGVQAAYSQNPVATSTVLTLTASNEAHPGFWHLDPPAQSGSIQDYTSLNVYVVPTVPFSIGIPQAPVVVPVSGTATTHVVISPLNGYAGAARLSTSTFADGITAAFDASTAIGDATLSISASNAVPLGDYSVNVSASDGIQTLTRTIPITVVSSVPTATPNFSIASGTYASAQTVTMSDATPGAAIYYTVDGTTPSTSSLRYQSPIPVSASQTIKAIALAAGFMQSSVATATYTINLPLPSFQISGTAATVALGTASSTTSTITVTPTGGFSGMVNLTCGITSAVSGTPPTCSIPVTLMISGSQAQTTVLTVNVSTSSAALQPGGRYLWIPGGGAVIASILIVGIPKRKWPKLLWIVLLFLPLPYLISACGGSSSSFKNTSTGTGARAAAGTYSITVTGTSGSITQTGTISLIVH